LAPWTTVTPLTAEILETIPDEQIEKSSPDDLAWAVGCMCSADTQLVNSKGFWVQGSQIKEVEGEFHKLTVGMSSSQGIDWVLQNALHSAEGHMARAGWRKHPDTARSASCRQGPCVCNEVWRLSQVILFGALRRTVDVHSMFIKHVRYYLSMKIKCNVDNRGFRYKVVEVCPPDAILPWVLNPPKPRRIQATA